MNTLNPIVYLTCEMKSRDLDSRMLIAAHLVKMGYHVMVGQYWALTTNNRIGDPPRGCYVVKTVNTIQVGSMANAKARGHVVVAADEEAMPAAEYLAAETADEKTFDFCDAFLAISDLHARALHLRFPNAGDRISVVGTARTDLFRHANPPRPHERPYILVNTSTGVINSIWGDEQAAVETYIRAIGYSFDNPEHMAVVNARVAYEHAALGETKKLIAWLRDNTGLDIILRPHPSEKVEMWRDLYRAAARPLIVEGTDPLPWIKHAALLFHNDSTTGIEAAMLGTPVINVSPVAEWAKRLIVREVNCTVATADEAVALVPDFLRNHARAGSLDVFDIFPRDAAERTARAIAAFLPPPGPLAPFNWVPLERTDVQRNKFTVTPQECMDCIRRVFPLAGAQVKSVIAMDDSLFLLTPKGV
ncbi:MAG: hypothetical protein K1X51_10115 [Rhodospirillaceae bacterium]|nr:hypothetical protein [Rhodospirillaceae bacterium]